MIIPNIHIVIPACHNASILERCLSSVINSNIPNNCFITIINIFPSDPKIASLLESYSENTKVKIFNYNEDIEFAEVINYGINSIENSDIIILQGDTEVPPNWIQRLQQCAYFEKDIGTVTPFTNNAPICSYPKIGSDNLLPPGYSTTALDKLFQEENRGIIVDIPYAPGFCTYIKMDCLKQIGSFEDSKFCKIYSEVNDFSLRATNNKWRHVLCADLFVYHSESYDYIKARDAFKEVNIDKIEHSYPTYCNVNDYIERDPDRYLRYRIDLRRLFENTKKIILFISHPWGGGTNKHEREIANLFGKEVTFIRLTSPIKNHIALSWFDEGESLCLYFSLPNEWNALIKFLNCLDITRIHFHHLLNIPALIKKLPKVLGLPYDFTIHDYYSICPRISLTTENGRYCGEPDANGCKICLKTAPKYQRNILVWREAYKKLLEGADRVLAPSYDVAERLTRYFTLRNLIIAPHPNLIKQTSPTATYMHKIEANENLRIAVIGALIPIKGANVLEAAALDAHNRQLPLEFTLIGSVQQSISAAKNNKLIIKGAYKDENLLNLIEEIKPHLIWFPALWPETYSYTLSAAIASGLPIIAPNLGAFSERLASRPWSWICPWYLSSQEWNDFFITLIEINFRQGNAPDVPSATKYVFNNSFQWSRDYLNFSTENNTINIVSEHAISYFAHAYSHPKLSFNDQVKYSALLSFNFKESVPLIRRIEFFLLNINITKPSIIILRKITAHIKNILSSPSKN